jgi:ABC-2 type transport system ATP-binding protein
MYALEINNLTKKYGSFTAVDDISFNLTKGEIFGLLGPNGAGKTTTISIISTLETLTSGSIKVFEKDLIKNPYEIKQIIGIVPQEIISHGFFNVDEILKFQSGYYGIKDNQAWIDFILDKLELSSYRYKMASTLSGGYKRRLLVAKALIHKPKILILDEPTAGVDIDLRQKIWEFIQTLNNEGITILLTTHYLEEAEKLCDRIGIINFGKILQIDKTQNLIENYTSRKITLYFKTPIEKISSKYLIKMTQDTAIFDVPRNINLSDLLQEASIDWKLLKDIKIKEGSLEDAFRNIIFKDKQ